ncbi:TB2/DP1, HVA22 family-domain-containing protein [Dunaliella salina]|uniref:HVA22-like protein n=1 Tax=Dunaliella salina TaxID=3046 RepID=A0ABQ7GCB3_DUNSA|nr:TB2/DP1, HVA22 family-domain-containing protein [Dunaliella salina]|eukprot:KAF5832246.1 TB2/DP1, HVA22 family-domain-containing protein [Dunaliella salina]
MQDDQDDRIALAYTWPSYQTYKAFSSDAKNDEELSKWCIYWIILGFFLTLESFADRIIWWLPLYHESKLICLVLMWHPRINGAQYVYSHFVQPLLSKHESMIDSTLAEAQARIAGTLFGHLNQVTSQIMSHGGLILEHMRAFSERGQPGANGASQHIE